MFKNPICLTLFHIDKINVKLHSFCSTVYYNQGESEVWLFTKVQNKKKEDLKENEGLERYDDIFQTKVFEPVTKRSIWKHSGGYLQTSSARDYLF